MQDINANIDDVDTSFVAGGEDVVALMNNPNGTDREEESDESAVHLFQNANPRKNLSTTFEQLTNSNCNNKVARVVAKIEQSSVRPPLSAITHPRKPTMRSNLSVYLRIRPLTDPFAASTMEVLAAASPDDFPTAVRTYPPASSEIPSHRPTEAHAKQFDFTQVLTPTSSQQCVYETVAAPLIQNILASAVQSTVGNQNTVNHAPPASALLFSYGITNAGKTHTVLGTLKDPKTSDDACRHWGIIPRTIQQILERTSTEALDLYLSFFEIYQENIYDLLPKTSNRYRNGDMPPDALKVRETHGQTIVRDLAKHRVRDVTHGIDLTLMAHNRRHTSSNNLNADSSRSHCVCQLQLVPCQKPTQAALDSGYSTEGEAISNMKASTIWIVDLAGSERSKRTQTGVARQKEASQINRSLMTLMRCLTAMREKKNASIIPFRESKVTHIFMGHLTGPYAANTAMIVNVHPSVQDFEETQHVLGYAVNAKLIPMNAIEAKTKRTLYGVDREYDLNGHRRKPLVKSASSSSLSVGNKRPHVTKTVSSNAGLLAKMVKGLKKLSPIKCHHRTEKRRLLLPPSFPADFVQPEPSSKRSRVDETASNKTSNANEAPPPRPIVKSTDHLELAATREALREAQDEINRLKSEKDDLLEDLGLQEQQIRSEVSKEMEQRLKLARERSHQEVERMRLLLQQQHEQSQSLVRKAQEDHLDRQLEALMDKVDECEEEMKRMRDDHEIEIEGYQTQLHALQHKSENRIAELESNLETCQEQVERLKRSKMELMNNYEKLLAQGVDETITNQEEDPSSSSSRENDEDSESDNLDDGEEENRVPLWKQKLTRKKQQPPLRKVLGNVSINQASPASVATLDSVTKLAFPKRPSVLAEDGMYRRPMGRAPKGHEWDASVGAWKARA